MPTTKPIHLTKRQLQVLRQLALAKTNKEIAKHLRITPDTVKEHLAAVFIKLKVDNRTAAALWAVENGILL